MTTFDQHIVVTVDAVIFSIIDNKLQVLLLQRNKEPFKDYRSIPGGVVPNDMVCETAMEHIIFKKTGIKKIFLEQLYTFSGVNRDPRSRTLSVSYISIGKVFDYKQITDSGILQFYPLKQMPALGFDHLEIIKYAYQRLKYKLEYTNVAQYFLPKEFTLTQLQKVYEIIMGYTFDVRNFRKKMLGLHIIKETGTKEVGNANRPAKLYHFINKQMEIVNIL